MQVWIQSNFLKRLRIMLTGGCNLLQITCAGSIEFQKRFTSKSDLWAPIKYGIGALKYWHHDKYIGMYM